MSNENYEQNKITALGKGHGRYSNHTVVIKDLDRMRHVYVLGRTGGGKSTLLLNMAISDINRGNGICIIDAHGDLSSSLLSYIPKDRIKDVVYFNVADSEFPIAFNPLQAYSKKERFLIASGIISTFKKMWVDAWGNRMEHILRYTLLALLEYPSATLLDISRMLTDDGFRSIVLRNVRSRAVLSFWRHEFARFTPGLRQEAINPILNKMGLFSANTIIRNIVGQHQSSLDLYEIMATQKILICNFSKGILGEDACSLLGGVMISSLQLAAQRRALTAEMFRVPFFLYVDEMHSFISQSFIDILAEMRKYNLSIFLTHQYLDQVNPKIYAAIFGNVGTIVSFALGSADASVLSKEFTSVILPRQFIDLARYEMYLRLMVDGVIVKPFSAVSLPITADRHNFEDEIVNHTRTYFSRSVEDVELSLAQKETQILNSHQSTLFG
jgi:hypothetical protein